MDPTFPWSIGATLPLVSVLFIVFILALWAYLFFFRFTAVTVSSGPSLLTSLGIFGTFVGVAWGLSGFDTGDVQGSVPALLDGLKTAFWSSIAGIAGAVAIKLRHLVKTSRSEKHEAADESATIDDLANRLGELRASLVGEEQSTILSRLELSRQDTNDRLEALKRSFDGFLVNAAESNSTALVSALREVIRDFNAKINEQFGQNFKQLNEAVDGILVWQEQCRQQIAETIEGQAEAAQRMAAASGRYQALVETAEALSRIAEQLGKVLSELEQQRERVDAAVSSVVDIAEYCRIWTCIAPASRDTKVSDGFKSIGRRNE